MSYTIHNKLVRDRIPEIIRESGKMPNYRVLSIGEMRTALKEKLQEEITEYFENPSPEEVADIFEVLDCLCFLDKVDLDQIEEVGYQKRIKNGSFDKRIFLESVRENL